MEPAPVPLFQTANTRKQLTGSRVNRTDVFQMIKRRARGAGLPETTCCHTFRATAITTYLLNRGNVENARQMAAHQSSQTTRLYNRWGNQFTLDEIERIRIRLAYHPYVYFPGRWHGSR